MFKVAHEIEKRGRLSLKGYKQLINFLDANGRFVEHRVRFNYMFDHPNKEVDLRVRDTNGEIEMTMKLGHVGSHKRKEILFKFGNVKCKDALDFLFHLGYNKGITSTIISDIYIYRGMEFVVAKVPHHSYYFEMEVQAKSIKEIKPAEVRLQKLAEKMGLTFFSKEEYDAYLSDFNRKVNKPFVLKD